MYYAIRRGRRTVAHLTTNKFGLPLCGRDADMTSNASGGKRTCRDCQRLAHEVPQPTEP
jgi:hypothetical protein